MLSSRKNPSSSERVIPTGKRKGQNPSLASIYRALATHEKASAYPDAVAQANAERHTGAATAGIVRPRRARVLEPVNAELRDRIQRSPRERER